MEAKGPGVKVFRIALTGDFLDEAGRSAYGDIGLIWSSASLGNTGALFVSRPRCPRRRYFRHFPFTRTACAFRTNSLWMKTNGTVKEQSAGADLPAHANVSECGGRAAVFRQVLFPSHLL